MTTDIVYLLGCDEADATRIRMKFGLTAAEESPESARSLLQVLHQRPCLFEFLEQRVHVAHPRAAAGRDPPPAAAVDHARPLPLARRHAEQDRLVLLELSEVGLGLLELRRVHP